MGLVEHVEDNLFGSCDGGTWRLGASDVNRSVEAGKKVAGGRERGTGVSDGVRRCLS